MFPFFVVFCWKEKTNETALWLINIAGLLVPGYLSIKKEVMVSFVQQSRQVAIKTDLLVG